MSTADERVQKVQAIGHARVRSLTAGLRKERAAVTQTVERAEKAEKQFANACTAFDRLKAELNVEKEALASLKHAIQEAVSDQNDASIAQFAREIRGDIAQGLEAAGQAVVLKVELEELEKLQAYHANSSEIFAALRVVFKMAPDEGLMDAVLKARARATDDALEVLTLVELRAARVEAERLKAAVLAETHEAVNLMRLMTNGQAKAWPDYEAAVKRLNDLRDKAGT